MTQQTPAENDLLVYVGTYTRGESEGIYLYRLDTGSGALRPAGVASGVENPSFLAIHPNRRYLYAVSEIENMGGEASGAVNAFAIDPASGALTPLNQQPSGGTGPCHLSVDKTGQFVLVANYNGGSVAVLPIQDDGRLGEASDFIQHEGASSVDPKRQDRPHAHSITLDAANRYAYAADLGLDKVLIYRFDQAAGKLVPHDEVQVTGGAGPRHFDFHPNNRYAYLIDELDNTVIAFAYDADSGALTPIQTVSALPEDFQGTSYCADVHVAPSGKFVYGSNRGHDSIVVFAIDEETGRLTSVDHESTRGEFPRNFALDPSGRYLLVANQNSNNVVTFCIDQETGKLTATGEEIEVPMPVCLKLLPLSA